MTIESRIEITGIEIPIVEDLDFLNKPVDLQIVLLSAKAEGIEANHRSYGPILSACNWGGYETYADLFSDIDAVAKKRQQQWASLEMPPSLVEQHVRWKRSIHRSVEGECHSICEDFGCW